MAEIPATKQTGIMREVIDLIIQGNSLPAIHAYIVEHQGDPEQTIAAAHQYFATIAARTPPATIMGMAMEQTRDLHRQALAVGDLSTALQCIKHMMAIGVKLEEYEFPEQPSPPPQKAVGPRGRGTR